MDQAFRWLTDAVETVENGDADAGFTGLQRLAASPDPRLSEQRFAPLIERLRALTAD
jgi:hypothetical protein